MRMSAQVYTPLFVALRPLSKFGSGISDSMQYFRIISILNHLSRDTQAQGHRKMVYMYLRQAKSDFFKSLRTLLLWFKLNLPAKLKFFNRTVGRNLQMNVPRSSSNIAISRAHLSSPIKTSYGDSIQDGIFKTRHFSDLTHLFSSALHQALFAAKEPNGFKTASKDPKWYAAMRDELRALKHNATWELVPRPTLSSVPRFLTLLVRNGYFAPNFA
nr:putative ribonuclease H-like domain-containing protein [Tanacetum cinerariifolium]